MTVQPAHLSYDDRARFYEALHRLLVAGVAPVQALEAVVDSVEPQLKTSLQSATLSVKKGQALVASLARQGLVGKADRALLNAAELAGLLEQTFSDLSEQYKARARRARNLRAKMVYPLAIIVLGVVLLPLPRLFDGELNAGEYVVRTLSLLLAIAGAVHGGMRLWSRTRDATYSRVLAIVCLKAPVLGAMVRSRGRCDMLSTLGQLVAAGMDAHTAFDEATKVLRNPILHDACTRAARQLRQGAGIADTLLEAGMLSAAEGYPLVSAGESAGRLGEMLCNQSRREESWLQSRADSVADWAPRIVYFVVVAVLASALLG